MKKLLSLAFAVIGIFTLLSFSMMTPVLAAPKDDVCKGVALTGGSCSAPSGGGPTVQSTITVVINILSILVGVTAVIMIIIGGFRYITSGGDSTATSGAKNTILYAIIGLVIVAMAQVIVRFVINQVTEP